MSYPCYLENGRKRPCAGRSAQLALCVFLFVAILSLAKDAAASIAFVQNTTTSQTSGQTESKAFAKVVTSGDLLLVGVFVDLGATVSVTDTLGNTFSQVAHQTVTGDHDSDVLV